MLEESEAVPAPLPVDYIDELQERYLRMHDRSSIERIRSFAADVDVLSRPPQLKPIASMANGDLLSASGIISAIELDRDDRLFAIGGVSKKIRIFELANVVQRKTTSWTIIVRLGRSRMAPKSVVCPGIHI